MPEVSPADVTSLSQGDPVNVVAVVTALAKAYTRGRGFTVGGPNADVAAVITTAAVRLLANPEQLPNDVGSVSLRGGFDGWTLAEQFALNRYRVRAQ